MQRAFAYLVIAFLIARPAESQDAGTGSNGGIPADAKYACPMESHPDEADPAKRGAYFSEQPGQCPSCGMEFKALAELEWVRLRQAAQGADVAYTCPDHQHVFSKSAGECPRCGRSLMPFKAMYTCPDPKHAGVISAVAGNCFHCGRGLAAYRGVWLDEAMADQNSPPFRGLADAAAFRCPLHPLVHSERAGACTICANQLKSTQALGAADTARIPSKAKYTCPMQECWQFSDQPGECSVCGMRLKPIDQVAWAKEMRGGMPSEDPPGYVCPMHPEQIKSSEPATCSICGMQLVNAATFSWPKEPPERVAAQVNYLTEHYLVLQSLLASDRTTDIAQQALALVSASDELSRHIEGSGVTDPRKLKSAAEHMRTAALRMSGKDIERDRVTFVDLSAAMTTVMEIARPSHDRWPKLYIYHCPMSKGDWIQVGPEKRNPYYGFKMLTCGELKDVK